jgi:hypothetical protein
MAPPTRLGCNGRQPTVSTSHDGRCVALARASDVFDVLSSEGRRTRGVRRVRTVAVELGNIAIRGALDVRVTFVSGLLTFVLSTSEPCNERFSVLLARAYARSDSRRSILDAETRLIATQAAQRIRIRICLGERPRPRAGVTRHSFGRFDELVEVAFVGTRPFRHPSGAIADVCEMFER